MSPLVDVLGKCKQAEDTISDIHGLHAGRMLKESALPCWILF